MPGLGQQTVTIAAQVAQLQPLACGLIFRSHRLDRLQRGLIDHTAVSEIDNHHLGVILHVKQFGEPICGSEEQRPVNLIDLGPFLAHRLAGACMDAPRVVPRIGQRRDDNANNHRHGKVFHYGHNRYQNDDKGIHQRHFAQDGKRVPREGADHHHEHHTNQRGQRDKFDHRRANEDEEQQEYRRRDACHTRPPTGFHVDHRLADHRTAAHAAKKSGDGIGHALGDTFLARATALARKIANKVQR